MMSYLEKIASEFDYGEELIGNIYKVAADEMEEITPDEVADDLFEQLEADGVDLENPEVQKEINDYLSEEELFDYGVNKTAEFIANDILETQEKIAGGESVQYQTAAASKAVAPFLTNDGAANYGSGFGRADGPIGSVVNAATDKNVFGGWGTLIGKNPVNSRAASAQGRLSSLLGSTNQKKWASDNVDPELVEVVDVAAEDLGQEPEEYLYDIGKEAMINEILEETVPGSKVAEILEEDDTLHTFNVLKDEATKEASDLMYTYVEEEADKIGLTPENFVCEIGLEKAAEYLKEAEDENEKKSLKEKGSELLGKAKDKSSELYGKAKDQSSKLYGKGKKFFTTPEGKPNWKTIGGTAVGAAGLTAGGIALSRYLKKRKKKKEGSEEPTIQNNVMDYVRAKLNV